MAIKTMWAGMLNMTILSSVKINDTQFQCRMIFHYAPGFEPVVDTDVVTRQGGTCYGFYNASTGECIAEEEECECETLSSVGEQYYPATGLNSYIESDYSSNGGFELKRTYNSGQRAWKHNYSNSLDITLGEIVLDDGSGVATVFNRNGDNAVYKTGKKGAMTKTATGWQFIHRNGDKLNFNNSGDLTRVESSGRLPINVDRSGKILTLTQGSGFISQLTEDENGQPVSFSSSDGTNISYAHSAREQITSVTKTSNNVQSVREYHYEDSARKHLLTGVTDERGVRVKTWRYDNFGRLTLSKTAANDSVNQYSYSLGGVSKTNPSGKVTNYQVADINGVKRLLSIEGEASLNCPASQSSCEYGSNGLLSRRINRSGISTTYQYNNRGFEFSRSMAAGTQISKTTLTEWHPTLPFPVEITEAGSVTTFDYDSSGRLINKSVQSQ